MRLTRSLNTEIAAAVAPLLKDLERQQRGDRQDAPGDTLLRLQLLISRLSGRAADRARKLVDTYGDALDAEHIEEMARLLRIPISEGSALTRAVMGNWRRENINLIKSIPVQGLDQVKKLVTSAISSGTRVEVVRKRIGERFAVSESRATLIARDQILKGNSALTQARHRDAGIREYRWSTSSDERVRDMHAELDGQIFSWDDPPVTNEQGDTNHPGTDYQCRCVAVPIIPLP